MAAQNWKAWVIGIDLCESARNFARLLIDRHGIAAPVNIESLLSQYADLEVVDIPFDFDGIALDIGNSSRPKVVINGNIPEARRRFTAAHELGHVIIPWHRGVFLDDIALDDSQRFANLDAYMEMERQANAFASEILMPQAWLLETMAQTRFSDLHARVIDEAGVSPVAAAINIMRSLPPGHIYAVVDSSGLVLNAGRSEGTLASAPAWHEPLQAGAYDYAEDFASLKRAGRTYMWWKLPSSYDYPVESEGPPLDWRIVLDEMLADICSSPEQISAYKMKVNGVIGYVNSACKRGANYTEGGVRAAAIQRFTGRTEYANFSAHEKFHAFVAARVSYLFRVE
ncbi:ImmA/IrrE family metallo-endopeptidase [Pseudoxanthomonas sp. JBR18]|uniref:ImmA/IrrE family metallo-endopeptidase n=1 Tax=Pseudoxanthomonas sp. JBR18 TaxID=2969308 RepID=UPI00230678F7|nr:ImmA/IrrE family metallo-endopeptidase [Pseudoxanthomonas sp. JBR18]WCE06203.1 ImmA/IrrE family metallo-endopeptidase [Pseudoxanthomonas sp. JBR18]